MGLRRLTETEVEWIDDLLRLIAWAQAEDGDPDACDPSEYWVIENWGRNAETVVWGIAGVAVLDPVDGVWMWADDLSAWPEDARRYYSKAYRRMFNQGE